MALNNFPQFSDGNVEIHFSSTDKKYVLHGHALALHSTWFKASLSERWSSGGEATMVDGKNHWFYELRFEKESALGMLIRKRPTASTTDTEFIAGKPSELPKGATKAAKAIASLNDNRILSINAHKDVLACLYHLPPSFTTESFSNARESIMVLARTAEMYGCEAVVHSPIENYLLKLQSDILALCAKDPMSMLELAMPIKCDWIFMEAAVNLIGNPHVTFKAAKPRLVALGIDKLIEEKRSQFKEKLEACEFAMFQLPPRSLVLNDWEIHTAIIFFRHWLFQELWSHRGSKLTPGYAQTYYTISKKRYPCAESKNEKTQMRYYLKNFFGDINDNDFTKMQTELDHVFTAAARTIQPILRDISRRQENSNGEYGVLRFMGVDADELPWAKK